jgi:hypothetical protein
MGVLLFFQDAERFILDNRHLVESTPLQLYFSNLKRYPRISFLEDRTPTDDSESDSSGDPSVWSAQCTDDSQSSFGGWNISEHACGKLAVVLCEDIELRHLYAQASSSLDRQRFVKSHDKLLKGFFTSLRSEVSQPLHVKAVRLLRHHQQRQQVTDWIYGLCTSSGGAGASRSRLTLDQSEDREDIFNRYFQSQGFPSVDDENGDIERDSEGENTGDEAIAEGADGKSNSDATEDDNESDSEASEDDRLPIPSEKLESVIKFLTEGPAYQQLKSNIHALVHPPTKYPRSYPAGRCEEPEKTTCKAISLCCNW